MYLQSIMPTEEDRSSPAPPPPSSDVIATDTSRGHNHEHNRYTLKESTTLHDGTEKNKTEAAPDNPFLRPPKRMKLELKLLSNIRQLMIIFHISIIINVTYCTLYIIYDITTEYCIMQIMMGKLCWRICQFTNILSSSKFTALNYVSQNLKFSIQYFCVSNCQNYPYENNSITSNLDHWPVSGWPVIIHYLSCHIV